MTSDYGTALLNITEENNRDASEARFVLSCGAKMITDIDVDKNEFWSCDVCDGRIKFLSKTYFGAIEKMYRYLKHGTKLKDANAIG